MRHKDNKIKQKIILAITASVMTISVVAQTPVKQPTLVVGIVINGLRSDYIDLMRNHFGENGFNRILNNGAIIENVEYGNNIDATAATAMLFSGASTSVNGISSKTVYDIDKKQPHPVLLDPTKIGNYTDETYSPSALLVSTISDEIRINGGGIGYVYSIAPDAQQSIIMAGHAGNSAFWINDITGKWATTTFYKDVPTTIQSRNLSKPLSSRLDTLSWTPSMSLDNYPYLPEYKRHYPFRHTFSRSDKNRYKAYKESAPVNTEVTSVATDYIKTISLGKRGVMDMLNISYTVVPYSYTRDGDNRVELMDSYIKLDAELSNLFNAIDRNVGLNNTLIFIAGTPAPMRTRRDDEKWNIPSGEFSSKKAISLLNMYLMAIYGNGNWVNGIHNKQIYLNHKLITERNKDIKEIRNNAADFVARMSGISQVYTIDQILLGQAGEQLRKNTHISHAGDLFLTIAPGWEIIENDGSNEIRSISHAQATSSPVFIMAPTIKAQCITYPTSALDIAPTIARILRIRSPNAAENTPLSL